jgi:hypothetical protein
LTNIPVIDITTWANSQPPLNVVPARIDLRQGPLATNQLVYLTIVNNSTNPITLSEPFVDMTNAPGTPASAGSTPITPSGPAADATPVDVKVTETRPGRYFTIVLKFPTGFELPAGHPGTFTIKTTHPQVPSVKVPIYQAARSTRPPVVLNRPAPPIPRPAAIVSQPPRPAPRPAPLLAFRPPDTGTGASTNRPPPPPVPAAP